MPHSIREVTFLALDVETTGVSPLHDRVVEIGLALGRLNEPPRTYARLIRVDRPIHPRAREIHGIDETMLAHAPAFHETVPEWETYLLEAAVVVGHNVFEFDMPFINHERVRAGYDPVFLPGVDTLRVARRLLPGLGRYSLRSVAEALQISVPGSHRAGWDAQVTLRVWMKFLEKLERNGVRTLEDLEAMHLLVPPYRDPLAAEIVERFREEGEVVLRAHHPEFPAPEYRVIPVWLRRKPWWFFEIRMERILRFPPEAIRGLRSPL